MSFSSVYGLFSYWLAFFIFFCYCYTHIIFFINLFSVHIHHKSSLLTCTKKKFFFLQICLLFMWNSIFCVYFTAILNFFLFLTWCVFSTQKNRTKNSTHTHSVFFYFLCMKKYREMVYYNTNQQQKNCKKNDNRFCWVHQHIIIIILAIGLNLSILWLRFHSCFVLQIIIS